MSLMMFAQIAGTGLQIASAMNQARAQRDQAAFDNYQLELKKQQDRIVARQKANLRNAQFASNEAANRATFFSKLNRDASDRSIRAFFAKQRELASEDVAVIQGQTTVALGQLSQQQFANSKRASDAYSAALLGAGSAVASGLFRYEQYRTTDNLFEV